MSETSSFCRRVSGPFRPPGRAGCNGFPWRCKGPSRCLGRLSAYPLKLAGVHGRGAQRSYLASLDQIVQRFRGLLDGRFIVEHVDDVEVQVVGAQPFERPINLPMDGLG